MNWLKDTTMKAKITKPQYNKRMAALVAKLAFAEVDVLIMCELFEQATEEITPELADFGNSFHDRVWELQQEIKSLDFEWNTRHFTGSDWNEYALVMNNID